MATTRPPASTGNSPVLKLRSPADMVAAVPYLLGFHPGDSVVVVALCGPRRRIGLTQRADLPPPAYVEELVTGLVTRLVRDGASEALVVIYPPPGYDDAALWQALRDGLAQQGVEIKDALRVAEGRWWSYLCEVARCCPPGGTPIVAPTEPGGPTQVAATLVHAGMVALPDRAALRATLRPLTGRARMAMDQALDRAEVGALRRTADEAGRLAYHEESTRLLAAAVRTCRDGDATALSPDATARLLVGLRAVSVRDSAAELMLVEAPDEHADHAASARTTTEAAAVLWTELIRRGTVPYDVAPATLLAIAAWYDGNGALARCAIDRALAGDPTYRLALLVEQALGAAINPAVLRTLGAALCRHRMCR